MHPSPTPFSCSVILGGVTDNSVSTEWGQRFLGGTHLPVPRERRQHPGSLLSIPQAFRALCTREKLLAAFGPFPVRLSTANTYSYRKVDVPFQEYVEHLLKPQDPARLGSDTLYFFGDNNFTEWGPLFQHYVPPPFRIPGTSPAYSFGIAGSGSGVPFHWHGPGFSEVIFGRKGKDMERGERNKPLTGVPGYGEGPLGLSPRGCKGIGRGCAPGVFQRWFLYPPDKTPHFHPNETTLAWLQHTYPTLPPAQRPLECTLYPGEVLYFPDRWWHATLNLDTSVFISTFLG
ncbi:hypothetical protein IHE44_0004371 [Lamprotornis superbus]|uniref:JmjC domain-containing protein n=1 Tax=Lamprotornis superbus TaxID=245042 RepID=A0A835TU40_9PASS|nr:hypothetical protein IHE44_0004371 [Lamprotornis superbus]